jgi:hypothetical protein
MRTRPRALVLTGALLLGLLMPTTAASAATPAGTAGSLDQASVQSPDKVRVRGWALDNAPGGAAINVAVYVDSTGYVLTTDQPRPDVQAVYGLPRSTYGYQADLPLTAGTHRVCAYALNNRDNPLLGCTSVTRSGDPLGVVDSVTFTDMQPNGSYTVLIKGWSFDPDAASSPGGVAYYVRGNDLGADSSVSKQITTTVARPDVEAAYGLSTSTVGYEISFPYFACTKSVRLYALNQAGPGSNPIFFNVWNLATDHNGSDNPGAPPTNTVLCN